MDNSTESKVKKLAELTQKSLTGFAFEEYTKEFNYFSSIFIQEPELKEFIGIEFYNSLVNQPKKKAMYMSFLERQEDPNPKSTVNAMRFIREMQIKTEFQTR